MSERNRMQVDDFAAQATMRYDEFIAWMIQHWPQETDLLTISDFNAGKREMDLLLGAKLHANTAAGPPVADVTAIKEENHEKQYRSVTPAPWP